MLRQVAWGQPINERYNVNIDDDLGNDLNPQPCSVADCINEIDGECGEDDVNWDHCERRRKAIQEQAK